MARGRSTALIVHLTAAERQTLSAWQRAPTLPLGMVRRGRVLLLLADQVPIATVAAKVGINRCHVYKWVQRFLAEGLDGLVDRPGRGRRRADPAKQSTAALPQA
ncbi:MAG: helix-turn-helix domain-containing protein [Candidatus Tectimicrobiota bacterium]